MISDWYDEVDSECTAPLHLSNTAAKSPTRPLNEHRGSKLISGSYTKTYLMELYQERVRIIITNYTLLTNQRWYQYFFNCLQHILLFSYIRGSGLLQVDDCSWCHELETFSRYWPFVRGIHRSSAISPHKGKWRGALMFSLISAWINGWVNNREAGDLRRHRFHYDVTVM